MSTSEAVLIYHQKGFNKGTYYNEKRESDIFHLITISLDLVEHNRKDSVEIQSICIRVPTLGLGYN